MHAENIRRADRAEQAAHHNHSSFPKGDFADLDPEDQQDAISDLICNLGHVADRYGFNFHALLSTAIATYEYEADLNYEGD